MYNFRTDLAVERKDIYAKSNKLEDEISGIETQEEIKNENIKVTRVKITNEEGSKAIQKPIGNYITIDIKNIKIIDEDEIEKSAEILSEELKKVIEKHVTHKEDIIVVGLGNLYVTPDALGPKTINNIEITRHLINYLPQYVDENTRPISAISPGVLGTTGIETVEILKGIVENIKPKLIIVIDSLASNSIERISSTIQISDTGIIPGGGVQNPRKEISINTLGLPVIAIGVPTVVDLETITRESIDEFIEKLQNIAQSTKYLNELKQSGQYSLNENTNNEDNKKFENMIVTPKEIDELIENMSDIVSKGINMAL